VTVNVCAPVDTVSELGDVHEAGVPWSTEHVVVVASDDVQPTETFVEVVVAAGPDVITTVGCLPTARELNESTRAASRMPEWASLATTRWRPRLVRRERLRLMRYGGVRRTPTRCPSSTKATR
jgi:hypothetical protein